MTGFRVREPEMRKLGMSLPGLRARAQAIAELPALGALTLAGLTSDPWTCSYRGIPQCTNVAVEQIVSEHPDLVAISALTASMVHDAGAWKSCSGTELENIAAVTCGRRTTALEEMDALAGILQGEVSTHA